MKIAKVVSHDIASLSAECETRQGSSSVLVQEALNLGFVIRSIVRDCRTVVQPPYWADTPEVVVLPPRLRLPQGHRFYPDCYREQLARLISWSVHTYQGDCWFITLTFPDYIGDLRAWSFHNRFLARLNQSYLCIPGAELLRSITSTEWQQRGVIHFHLLIMGRQLRCLSRKRWEHRWQIASGGFCANYQAEEKSAPYLAKHSLKGRLDSNLYFGGAWRGINPPRSVSRCCSKALSEAQTKWHYPGQPGQAACDVYDREVGEVAV